MSRVVVFAMGLTLVAGGALSIWMGYDIIQVERGWTEVIAGATAVTGGVVTISIGFLIGAIQRLASGSRATPPPGVTRDKRSDDDVVVTPAIEDRLAQARYAAEEHAPALAAAPVATFVRRPNPSTPPRATEANGVAAHLSPLEDDQTVRPGAWIDEALAGKTTFTDDAIPIDRPPDVLLPEDREIAEPQSDHAIEAVTPPVVGRYSFGGAKYILYEDGSIDAETQDGVVRFASLADLRKQIGGDAAAPS